MGNLFFPKVAGTFSTQVLQLSIPTPGFFLPSALQWFERLLLLTGLCSDVGLAVFLAWQWLWPCSDFGRFFYTPAFAVILAWQLNPRSPAYMILRPIALYYINSRRLNNAKSIRGFVITELWKLSCKFDNYCCRLLAQFQHAH